MSPIALLDELAWRGMLHQQTEGAERALAAGPVTGYAGFDPTAPSLHVGNLVPVMALAHLQRAGHRPVALVGGGTGLIGDPSGRTSERQLNTREVVDANARAIRAQLERFLDFGGARGALMRDNAEWLGALHAIDFMRDVGKHFSVNMMLAKDSVRSRMDAGISYTEFSYMLLQAYDFLELNRRDGVTLQVGGSDQWGNITAGTELVRRVAGREAHGVTLPLMTTAAGTKFGKSEAGAIWLDAERTSPYQFYQFWMQTDDRDAARYLRFFTLLSREWIETLDVALAERPDRREAQQALAREVTTRVHGAEAARAAAEVSAILFDGGDPRSLSRQALGALEREVPFERAPLAKLASNGDGGIDVLTALTESKLAASRGAAKRLVEQGGVYVNGERLTTERRTVSPDELLVGEYLFLRKGKRDYALLAVAV